MSILDYKKFYLVGIKGVAMTSMVQLLLDAGKTVTGCDLAEEFVTQTILDRLKIKIDQGFDHPLPDDTECVIFTAAHKGRFNPMVQQAVAKKIPTLSHAQAQAEFFNLKKGIAVCGVGGKSTVSAMLAWIFVKNKLKPSFAVGVGNIPGLEKTGQYNSKSLYFIAEADEYVTDPSAPSRNEEITPRFSFLQPYITVCTNLKFDHPDVYQDFEHTKTVFYQFFNQVAPQGYLVIKYSDLVHKPTTSAKHIVTFGKDKLADFSYNFKAEQQQAGKTVATVIYNKQEYLLELKVPGEYNIQNALAAIAVAVTTGIKLEDAITALQSFASTQRRFENRGTKHTITYFDDYAHHPNEIRSAIKALNTWYPDRPKVVVFQPHTYSRTKQLLHEFIHSFREAQTVYLLDIFASARENYDPSITSDDIVNGIKTNYKEIKTQNLHDIDNLANFLTTKLDKNTVVLTLGAGDIYKVHDKIK